MYKQWHAQHKMPAKATADERVAWHLEHQKHCDCRPIPAGVQKLIAEREREIKATDR